MKIEVRLFATLREGRGKVVPVDAAQGALAVELIDALNIPHEDIAILLINGRDGSLDQVLKEGDILSIFPPVGGG